MFDTMKVAKKIREARITQNMTQMNLADAMTVSYQAVSNWERGNSMPDISKLEQLCLILDISLEELLGSDSSKTLNHIRKKDNTLETNEEAITLQEIQDVAPLLPPVDVKNLVDKSIDQQGEEKINLSAIIALAPFLDEKYLDNLIRSIHVSSLHELTGLAPFLSDETLHSLVMNADPEKDMSAIIALAPFLDEKYLDNLIRSIHVSSLHELTGLAPFLSDETLHSLVMNADPEKDMSAITALAPFLAEKTLNDILEKVLEKEDINIAGLYPFLSQEALQKIAEKLSKSNAFNSLESIAPFL